MTWSGGGDKMGTMLMRRNITPIILILVSSLLLLPLPGRSQEEDCQPTFDLTHMALLCADAASTAPLLPNINLCDPLAKIEFADDFYDLNCQQQGLKGYFAPTEWLVAQENKREGDGGVDVTGAPDARLVEGADGALAFAAPGGILRLRRVIPAEGYVAFDLVKVGSSIYFSPNVAVLVNNEIVQQGDPGTNELTVFSPLLKPGDLLDILIGNDATVTQTVSVRNFIFYSNASGVLVRHWKMTDERGRTATDNQFIVFNTPTLADIRFPEDLPSIEADPKEPHTQGLPYLDRDGNPATTDDQFSILDAACAFRIDYWDEPILREGENLLLRHWLITDVCQGSSLEEDQLFRFAPSADNPNANPLQPLQHLDSPRPSISPTSLGNPGMLN